MYDGTRYDFNAALESARTAERDAGLTAEQRYWQQHFPESPAEPALRKHSKRFGNECVSEIADAYDLTATAAELTERNAKRQRRTTDSLRAQVLVSMLGGLCRRGSRTL